MKLKRYLIEDFGNMYHAVKRSKSLEHLLRRQFPTGYNFRYNLTKGTAVVTKVGNELDCYFVQELY